MIMPADKTNARGQQVTVKAARASLPVRVVSSNPRLRGVANRMAVRIGKYVPETGKTFSPFKLSAEAVFIAVLTLPLIIAGPVLALIMHPVFLALVPVPFLALLVPWLRIRSWIGDRKRSVDEELPFFAVHAAILQTAGRDIYNALSSIIGRGVFPQIGRDAAIMKRNTTYFRMGPLEGVEEMGRTTPNPRMSALLLGYTSEWRSGGDAVRYLERKTSDFLDDIEHRWNRYVEHVSTMGELTMAAMFLMPLLVLMAVFLSPGMGETIAIVFLTFALPMFTTLSVVLIRSAQPKSYDVLNSNVLLFVLGSLISAALPIALALPTWLILVASLGGGFLAFGIPIATQLREINAHESALPQFLRDVTEYQKMGYDLVRATTKVAEENKYNPAFEKLLKRVAWQLGLGHRFSEVEVRSRSWLTRTGFFHLAEVAESGAYETASLEQLTGFVNNALRTKRRAKSGVRMYRVLSMATPVMLAVVVGALTGVLQSLALYETAPGVAGTIPAMPFAISPVLLSLCYAIVVVAAVGSAITSSYAADFTLKNTVWLTISLALAGAGIFASEHFASLLGGVL